MAGDRLSVEAAKKILGVLQSMGHEVLTSHLGPLLRALRTGGFGSAASVVVAGISRIKLRRAPEGAPCAEEEGMLPSL